MGGNDQRPASYGLHCVGLGSSAGSKIPIESGSGEAFLREGSGGDVVLDATYDVDTAPAISAKVDLLACVGVPHGRRAKIDVVPWTPRMMTGIVSG